MTTADEFRNARFATHPDGRIAARIDPDDSLPWIAQMPRRGRAYRTDEDMAADGWSPLDETRPSEGTISILENGISAAERWNEAQRRLAALSAAPTTEEGDPSVDYHAMWWKAESALEDLREQYGTVVREKDEWEANEQEQAVRADEAEAFAALWKETARRLAHDRRFIGRVANTAAERLDEAWARAEKAEWERDNARYSRDLWVEAVEKAEARAERAEQEREGLRVALEKATVERNRAELRVEDLESMTAREHLAAAWSAAHVPADGTIPAGTRYITHFMDTGEYKVQRAPFGPVKARGSMWENRLLDPPPPARHEGAEGVESQIEQWLYAEGPDDPIKARDLRSLADFLAERGVRVEDGEER